MKVRLDVCYRGTTFHGWADNPGVPTVEALLRRELTRVLRHEVQLEVAGRTDKGVHASAQVVSFYTDADHFDPGKLRSSLNKLCAPEVSVASVRVVADDFHARFSATGRRYHYRILNAATPDPLRADQTWYLPGPLDAHAMGLAAAKVLGERDFSAFCRPPKHDPGASLVRLIRHCIWTRRDDELVLDIEANAFCHQMVRSLVGAFVAVGRHRLHPSAIDEMLTAPDRSKAPSLAPPQGLTLVGVSY